MARVAVAAFPVQLPDDPLTLPVMSPVKGPLNAVAVIVPVNALADLSHTTFELAPVNVASPSTINELRDPKVTIEELTTLEARVVPVRFAAASSVASVSHVSVAT